MRTIPSLALLLSALLLSGCGEGPVAAGRFTLQGEWAGRGYPYDLALSLRQDGENRVRGVGTLHGLREVLVLDTLSLEPLAVDTLSADTVRTGSVDFDVRGEWAFPSFTLALRREGYAEAAYSGTFQGSGVTTSADTVAGRLEGAGFDGVSVPIVRR